MAKETSVERIRFTTSHPKDFDEKLIKVLAQNQSKICEVHSFAFSKWAHLCFRTNESRLYQGRIPREIMIKEIMPNVVLSTDIIVGFPGETEAEFLETLSLIKEVAFETVFAFKDSPSVEIPRPPNLKIKSPRPSENRKDCSVFLIFIMNWPLTLPKNMKDAH